LIRHTIKKGELDKLRKIRSRGFTLVELVIVMGLSFVLLLAVWQLFRISQSTFRFADEEISAQRAARIIMERLKSDFRAAVFTEGLVGDKFILQNKFELGGKEVGATSIKFARFNGFDDTGRPIIEKVVYMFDRETGVVKRGNWTGNWEQKNDTVSTLSPLHSLSSKKNSANGSYLYFNTFYTDTDRKGLKGRLFVFVGMKAAYGTPGKMHEVKINMIVGPKFITSKDREPFWNYNPKSKLSVEEFQK